MDGTIVNATEWRWKSLESHLCCFKQADWMLRFKMHHHAKFRCDGSNHCWDIDIFQQFIDFSRWQLSTILDLLYASIDHKRTVLGGLNRCTKYGWNWCSSFDNKPVLTFCERVWLKNAYLCFFGWFFSIWPPRWDTISMQHSKGKSIGHNDCSGALTMVVSLAVPEKLFVLWRTAHWY